MNLTPVPNHTDLYGKLSIMEKVPLIPPLLINNKLIENFKEKANHFNALFASHCK